MVDKIDATAWIDAYIAELDPPFRDAIAHLRHTVKAAAPEAEEIVTYSMPGIGLHGPLVSYFAFKKHCSLFPMGDSVFVGMADDIAPWRTSKGTLQFASDALPPDELIHRIVAARIKENVEKHLAKKPKRAKA